ncbi:MAG: hypothetical protein JNK72_06410 [Myxococcales bacterium]|nr:hypothetical protein [Myxococcales bacterium]
MKSLRRALCSLGLVLSLSGLAAAQPQGQPGNPGGRPPEPPAEAFTACQGHNTGDACTVNFGPHTISGTCAAFRDQRMICRPDRMPPPPQGQERGPGPS